jgi:hypothetical protein
MNYYCKESIFSEKNSQTAFNQIILKEVKKEIILVMVSSLI